MNALADRANYLAALPWTYIGPVEKRDGDQVWYELRIRELPDFFLAEDTHAALFQEIRPALVALMISFLEHGDEIPRPPVRWVMGWFGAERKQVKGPAPTPNPPTLDESWNEKIPGVSGNVAIPA